MDNSSRERIEETNLTYRNRSEGVSDGVYNTVRVLGSCGRNGLLPGRGSAEGRGFRYALADGVREHSV